MRNPVVEQKIRIMFYGEYVITCNHIAGNILYIVHVLLLHYVLTKRMIHTLCHTYDADIVHRNPIATRNSSPKMLEDGS